MKARFFPKLDIPDDLNELERFIGQYDTVQEQIEFLKYVKLEMELFYELKFKVEIDAMDINEYDDWNRILDKKIKFYEDILNNSRTEEIKAKDGKYGLFGFQLERIKQYAEKLEPDEAIIYYKYVLKEFDREKRENELLFINNEDREYLKNELIKLTTDEEYSNVNIWGTGEKQKKLINNFEKNIINEIKFYEELINSGRKGDDKNDNEKYEFYDFNIEKIKEYGNNLDEKNRYKFYLRLQIELKRILTAFKNTEFNRFDRNIYTGFKEFMIYVEHILNKEQFPELNVVVTKNLKELNKNPEEKDFNKMIFNIVMDITDETNRHEKTNELISYELEYLKKILDINEELLKKEGKLEEQKKLSDTGNNFQECLERGTKYYLKNRQTRLSLLDFYQEMKKYFGDDIDLCKRVFYRIVNDIPVIMIFGYDMEDFRKRIEMCSYTEDLNKIFDAEKNKTEKLLQTVNNYKAEYYIKWEKRYNQNLDDDWLEEQGYTEKSDVAFDIHYNGWMKYYLEDIQNAELTEILNYGFSGRLGEFDIIEDKNSVRNFLENLEKELKDYKDEIVQAYVLKNSRLDKRIIEKKVEEKAKKKWTMNKSEFARLVSETYNKNRDNYKSLRDANNKLFDEYEFEDKDWTKEQSYDLVRKKS